MASQWLSQSLLDGLEYFDICDNISISRRMVTATP